MKKYAFWIILLIALYCSGYIGARFTRLLIHTTYIDYRNRKQHNVRKGYSSYYGHTRTGRIVNGLAIGCHYVFAPLRLLETGIWKAKSAIRQD